MFISTILSPYDLPFDSCLVAITKRKRYLLVSYCLLPITYCLLPIARCLLPKAIHLYPNSNLQ
jgi:hypothetical protein